MLNENLRYRYYITQRQSTADGIQIHSTAAAAANKTTDGLAIQCGVALNNLIQIKIVD